MTWAPVLSELCTKKLHGYCNAGRYCDCRCHRSHPRQKASQKPTERPLLFCRHKDHHRCPVVVAGSSCVCACHAKSAVA